MDVSTALQLNDIAQLNVQHERRHEPPRGCAMSAHHARAVAKASAAAGRFAVLSVITWPSIREMTFAGGPTAERRKRGDSG